MISNPRAEQCSTFACCGWGLQNSLQGVSRHRGGSGRALDASWEDSQQRLALQQPRCRIWGSEVGLCPSANNVTFLPGTAPTQDRALAEMYIHVYRYTTGHPEICLVWKLINKSQTESHSVQSIRLSKPHTPTLLCTSCREVRWSRCSRDTCA